MRRISLLLLLALSVFTFQPQSSAHAQAYVVTNLFSDGSVTATASDPNFQNPWGMSVSPTWWINAANTGFSFVVSAATNTSPFKVVVPAATSAFPNGSPAGVVTTTGASGMVLSNGAKASFLFSTLDGAIYGWDSALGQNGAVTLIAVNNASSGACYPGLALLNSNATTSYLLAPNFGTGATVEVYDQNFKPAKLSGSFTDPNLPSGYGPWSIHILNNQVWIAYAVRSTAHTCQQVPGVGSGIVDVFDLNGNFVARAVTGGNLNAPYGIAFAPSTGFGIYSGDLLIGNFGDGVINVYDPKTYAYLGQLMDSTGKPLVYASLWDVLAGGTPILNSTTVSGGSNTNVYFVAGLANEAHGLLAAISNGTVSGASPTFAFSSSAPAATVPDGNSATFTLAAAPVNGFSGTVTLSCTGLPMNSNCIFTPTSLNVTSGAAATTTLTITTMGSKTTMGLLRSQHKTPTLAFASLLPLSLLLLLRRRNISSRAPRLFTALALLILASATIGLILGCGGTSAPAVTPTGASTVVVKATSSSGASQQVSIALTVQ
jgi:uncharacterized protein (TIGR03118 family)